MAKPASDTQGIAARRAALRLLDGVLEEQRLLSEMGGEAGPMGRLSAPDRARAQRLVTETLRQMERADKLLGPHLRKRPALPVHNILRLGTYEICADGAAPHGVINALVEIARKGRHSQHQAGMINAVLRKLAETGPADWAALPPPKLPKWLRKQMVADYGKAAVEAMEAAHAKGAPLDLSLKPGTEWASKLIGTRLPTGSLRLTDAGQVSALPGYTEGAWWVQDAAAALPVQVLAPKPGEKLLDLCAAPGGKTMQMAAAGAQVTALDISEHRMARVQENLARTQLTASCVVGDALEFSETGFDAILLDAPCTATGTIRRHPDLPHAKDGADFPGLFALQERLIDHALTLLAPGGRLIFCTCSLLPDEGEIQIEDALKRHPGLRVDSAALDVPGIDPSWKTPEGGLRLRPDYWAEAGGMDGFYIAALRKD
ncbi:RsmB/NOP family class I SAM-dependent RNA methyltransferase [Pseudoruegeria sp. SHC-113]|uniref:RsmB/NOP family class I SAM-dependent RNA methyltransferase n=1 Tax=Pseudoruegeria sp. SHC-113 TaxID=2855439 RepID=UPI0021BA4870|nr:RsmB/NOP family class I SAM-dependent RNA methyltransferase [Pseudoruegeria sp. SHC-113]MCT8159012.1 methyltransferase domain-containing protein [Pseudoruegeria sp. SHC-113]